ncbi:uncharacterized protein LOC122920788 isoform X1 [Bufo gargarizans]|uniref:uncharacterized protein LOC122920788 isoform X1 n=1 Tax=Bufo gargarizans TaxID=30331 RepID=UPI001CF45EBF|nr:uncharacterized protein LOC122920788 isoform X1 [Bufo gargarizans]
MSFGERVPGGRHLQRDFPLGEADEFCAGAAQGESSHRGRKRGLGAGGAGGGSGSGQQSGKGDRCGVLAGVQLVARRSTPYTVLTGAAEGTQAMRHACPESLELQLDTSSEPPHEHGVLDTLLLSTFTSWKAFFPLVKDDPNGTYTFITGGAGERLLMPGTGFLTLGAAGALAFSQVVREEYPDIPCKLNEVKINMGVAPPERLGPGYVSHLEVGEAVASLVEKRRVSHTVLCANSTTDLKTLILEGKV